MIPANPDGSGEFLERIREAANRIRMRMGPPRRRRSRISGLSGMRLRPPSWALTRLPACRR